MCNCKDSMVISKAIKRKREQMIASAKLYGFTNEKTIRFSQELDILINEYQRCFRQNEKDVVVQANGNMVTVFVKQFAYA